MVGVCWYEADAYARWVGKQLPNEQMWEKAARGTDERIYPWGDAEPDGSLCNYGSKIGKTTPVKQYSSGISPYGLYDMLGNVWEWCEDWSSSEHKFKVLRGGSWVNYAVYLRASYRDRFNPDDWATTSGFVAPGLCSTLHFSLLHFARIMAE